MKATLLIIDDDAGFREDVSLLLADTYECVEAENGTQARNIIENNGIDIALLDLQLRGGESGLEVLQQFLAVDPDLPIILITEHASLETAVEAMKRGAYNYVSKTTAVDELHVLLNQALEARRLRQRASILQEEINRDYYRIIGESDPVRQLRRRIARYAASRQTVLIEGESGTGKELVARRLHQESDASDKPFVAINCAAIPRDLIESELFGHEAGAFTGAQRRKPGKIEVAGDGVVFFDEIGELGLEAQSKLLRILENREYERVGGVKPIRCEARIIAATNAGLEGLIEEGRFRRDLFYRLEMLTIHVPALRERREDIPPLIEHFLLLASQEMKTQPKHMTDKAIRACLDYPWPGNIRELRNAVFSAAIGAVGDAIDVDDLNPKLLRHTSATPAAPVPHSLDELNRMREEASDAASREVERRFLEDLLLRFDGNVSKAAEHVGIHRSNLHRMMKRCGLN